MAKQKKASTNKNEDNNKKGTKGAGGGGGDDAEQKVLEYLRRQNRPYSVTDISNNLHGAVTKAITQKVLTNLVDKEEVSCKTYGKQSVYVVKQDQFETPSPKDLNEMDTKIEELKKEVNDYKDRNKQLQSVLNGLNNSLTNEQIETKINGLEKENKGYEERLNVLRSGAKQLTEEEKKQIDELYEKNRKLWRQRKRMFEEVFNQIAEVTERKTKDLVEELGIETDPIDINEDPLKNL
ncbi:hypothetical protein Glove_184g50 [Diversispora epigaea]|uniref:Homologous-pairing protein 2 homolog n=1 Tax=Diversispora epigaea TaxID=1348612 RepID=A0A397IMQ0_9GLOM|nr:hypothetical protein Glove_184g50 [Diversispora epigaea]